MATIKAERDVKRGWVKVTVLVDEPTSMVIRLDPSQGEARVEFLPPPGPPKEKEYGVYLVEVGYPSGGTAHKIEAIKFLREVCQPGFGLGEAKAWIETPGGAPLPKWFTPNIAKQIGVRLNRMGYTVGIRERPNMESGWK